MHTKSTFTKPLIFVVITLFVAFLAYSAFLLPKFKSAQLKQAMEKSNSATYIVDMNFGQVDAVGFDVVLKFDPATTQVQTVTSILPEYEIYQNQVEDGIVSLTGIKSQGVKSPTYLTGIPVLTVPIVYSGEQPTIAIVPSYKKNTSKIMTKDIEPILATSESMVIRKQ